MSIPVGPTFNYQNHVVFVVDSLEPLHRAVQSEPMEIMHLQVAAARLGAKLDACSEGG